MKILNKSIIFNKHKMPNKKYRHEIKYEIDAHTALKLKNNIQILLNKDNHTDEYDKYTVHSLYFETPYNSDFIDKELGVKDRQKLRLRKYENNENYKLEIKSKSTDVATKYCCNLNKQQASKIINGDYNFLLDINTPESIYIYYQLKTQVYRPCIGVSYERYAYYFKSQSFRITFDTKIASFTNPNDIIINKYNLHEILDKTIIEIKYDNFVPHFISKMLVDSGINASAQSKYALAFDKTYN